MEHLTESGLWTRLIKTEPFDFMASRLWADDGVLPTSVKLDGNRALVFEYTYKGKGSTIRFEATWCFHWHKFYFEKSVESPLIIGSRNLLDSPFLTAREFLRDIRAIEADSRLSRVEKSEIFLCKEDLAFILRKV